MDYKENLHCRAISTKELILENDFVLQMWCLKFRFSSLKMVTLLYSYSME
jgi:hypothetical protein